MTEKEIQEDPVPEVQKTAAEPGEAADATEVEVEFAEGLQEADDAAVAAPEPDPGAEIERWKDVAARAQADLENYRKRMAREKLEAIQYANRGLLEQLLPVIDNFEMGLKAAESVEGGELILQGMSMVRKQLSDFLAEQGVEEVPSEGEAFDPNLHEALKQEPHATVPEGRVLFTLRRGYRLRDRLLRAANVIVSSGPPPAD